MIASRLIEVALPVLLSFFAEVPQAPAFPFDAATAAKYRREYAERAALPLEIKHRSGIVLVLIPPGTFDMGSPETEPGRGAGGYDETRHKVTISRPFYMGKHEVTVAQFRRFVEATELVTDGEKRGGGNAHDAKAVWIKRPGTQWRKPGFAGPFELRDDHPVVHVSHNDARLFCRWVGAEVKDVLLESFDLPTEAQWEWACRAGAGTRFTWGDADDATGKLINVGDRSLKRVHPDWPRMIMDMDDGHAFCAPVGSYAANAFGLHDMLGNVWEFCSTRSGPYPKDPTTDPGDLDPKRGFAVRGGGWSNTAADARCAVRNSDPPDFCHSNLGFRVMAVIRRK